MSTNQQDNYNVLLDSLNYYRQLADQLQDIINSTNTHNIYYENPFPNYNNIKFTDNANDNSEINNENDLQDSTFEKDLPLNLNNDENLYDEHDLKESSITPNCLITLHLNNIYVTVICLTMATICTC